jgi:5'-nucleotidase / UDP-sugar diphosphatase
VIAGSGTRRDFLLRAGGALGALALGGACRPLAAGVRGGVTGAFARPEVLFLVLADTHSAHRRYPAIVAALDRVRDTFRDTRLAVLFNGDLSERGNVVALRGGGEGDLAFLESLQRRVPVVFNLGNHEGALFPIAETVARFEALGVRVVGNIRGAEGAPLAPAAVSLPLGPHTARVMGIATDDLLTYRPEVRAAIRVPEPGAYAAREMRHTLGDAALPVVLSHAGTAADRGVLPTVPDGTLVVGGHDHLRYTHRQGRTLYLHTGSWGDGVTLVAGRRGAVGWEWSYEEIPLEGSAGEPRLTAMLASLREAHLRPEDREVVGHALRPFPLAEASTMAVAVLRAAAGAELAVMGNTSFGAGLPAGDITRHDLDAFLRFDGRLHTARISAALAGETLARANQFGEVPFADRTGEFLVAVAGPAGAGAGVAERLLVTDGWVPLNARRYLGAEPEFQPLPGPGVRELLLARLAEGPLG